MAKSAKIKMEVIKKLPDAAVQEGRMISVTTCPNLQLSLGHRHSLQACSLAQSHSNPIVYCRNWLQLRAKVQQTILEAACETIKQASGRRGWGIVLLLVPAGQATQAGWL